MKKLYFLFIFGVIISCCKKEEIKPALPHTIAEGYVIHSGTKMPLDSVRVSIWNGMPCSDPLGCNDGSIEKHFYDTTYTNSKGFFHIEIDGHEPIMFLYKKDYSFEYNVQGAVIGIIPLLEGENLDLLFEMDAPAHFKPCCFIGLNCLDSDTTFYGEGSIINPPSFPYYLGKGPHILTYRSIPDGWLVKGDKYSYFWFKYQINGVWNSKIDSVYIKSFTSYTDTLYY
jgi:hypothetical protein